jgi:hypothetical protein
MKTREPRNAKTTASPAKVPASPSTAKGADSAASAPSRGSRERERKQFGYYVDGDGKLCTDGMQERSKDELRKLFADPKVREIVGIKSDGVPIEKEKDPITPAMVHTLYRFISSGGQVVGQKVFKLSPQSAQHLAWSEEEVSGVTPLTQKILNRRLGPLLKKYAKGWEEEIMLGTIVAGIIGAKYTVAMASSRGAQPPQPPAPPKRAPLVPMPPKVSTAHASAPTEELREEGGNAFLIPEEDSERAIP